MHVSITVVCRTKCITVSLMQSPEAAATRYMSNRFPPATCSKRLSIRKVFQARSRRVTAQTFVRFRTASSPATRLRQGSLSILAAPTNEVLRPKTITAKIANDRMSVLRDSGRLPRALNFDSTLTSSRLTFFLCEAENTVYIWNKHEIAAFVGSSAFMFGSSYGLAPRFCWLIIPSH